MTGRSRDYVFILTAGGTIRVDLTATIEHGQIDEQDTESAGDAVNAVKAAIRSGLALITTDGDRSLIEPSAPLAYTFRRETRR